jgi:hypothetical protein
LKTKETKETQQRKQRTNKQITAIDHNNQLLCYYYNKHQLVSVLVWYLFLFSNEGDMFWNKNNECSIEVINELNNLKIKALAHRTIERWQTATERTTNTRLLLSLLRFISMHVYDH